MTLSTKTNSFSDNDFIDYLRDNPDIFVREPKLLQLVNLSDERGASSLLERQIDVLRTHLEQTRSAQQELINIALENEAIIGNFAKVTEQLIACDDLDQFARKIPRTLMQTFNLDEVGFKTEHAVRNKELEQQTYQHALLRMTNNKTVCDNKLPSAVVSLFFTQPVKSVALIPLLPLNAEQPVGIMALGSNDATKYTPDLGTTHLDALGTMAGICLQRLQSKVA